MRSSTEGRFFFAFMLVPGVADYEADEDAEDKPAEDAAVVFIFPHGHAASFLPGTW